MIYDPTLSPRFLGPEVEPGFDPEVDARIQRLIERRRTFDSPGWEEIAATLTSDYEAAKESLVTNPVTIEKVWETRGKVSALRLLIDLPRTTDAELDRLLETRKENAGG